MRCHMTSRMYNALVTQCHECHVLGILLSIMLIITITGPLEFCANGIMHYLPEEDGVRMVVDVDTGKPVKCPQKKETA